VGARAFACRAGPVVAVNLLLVVLAPPDATFVAGFKAWLRLGYCVKKGERAIRIIAPMPVKQRDRDSGEQTDEILVLFKAVWVFRPPSGSALALGRPGAATDRSATRSVSTRSSASLSGSP
jgi:hypothetical protein